MDFGYVLKRAWQIIWKFKVLWIFGILASCGQAGSSGGSNSGYRFSSQDINIGPQIEGFFNRLNPCVHCATNRTGYIFCPCLDCPGNFTRHNWESRIDPRYSESRARCRTPYLWRAVARWFEVFLAGLWIKPSNRDNHLFHHYGSDYGHDYSHDIYIRPLLDPTYVPVCSRDVGNLRCD